MMAKTHSVWPILFVLFLVHDLLAQSPDQGLVDTKLQELERFALTHRGNSANGAKLFRDTKRTKCAICHRVEDTGGEVGPDLSKIGGKFDRPHLIESLLEPSRQIVEGYRSSTVITNDGRSWIGVIKSESDDSLTLLDSENKTIDIQQSDIEARKTNRLSLMPDNLAHDLSQQEFVDLVAYLETLRSGFDSSFGAGVSGPIRVVDGFEVQTVVTNLSGATAMKPLADGRILICEQTGALRVIKNDKLVDQPMLSIDVDTNWERGLIGVTVDPDFPNSPYVYICYVSKDKFPHHRISRFTVQGDIADPSSEKILLHGDNQSKLGGNVPAGHQGGGIHFGTDGKLYVGIGEQTAGKPAQKLDSFLGKILRINPDGTIPHDNPLLDKTTGKYQSIWAYGCRNPFTLAVDSSTSRIFINDVGGKFEEINLGVAGANYGWPTIDHGPTDVPGFVPPQHVYPEASISGGDFLSELSRHQGQHWPSSLKNKYFFADFVHGWVKWIDPDAPAKSHEFAYGLRRPVDVRFGPDGALYVLLRNAWVIDNKFEGGTGSLMRIVPVGK